MHSFDYAAPSTLPEALALLGATPSARLLAGGTDLIVQMKARRRQPPLVINAKQIPELNETRYEPVGGLTLGAAVPCYRIAADANIAAHYPSLAEIAQLIGGVPIQGRATLGGNLCNAAPSADSVPLLIALRATALIASTAGARTIPVEEFCTAPGQNVLAPGEVLVSLHMAPPSPHSAAHYLRFIPRNEMDIAVVGAGVWIETSNGKILDARLALASVAPTPLFVPAAGEALKGLPAEPGSFDAAAAIAQDAARPISDMRGTADYRRHLCGVLTRRAFEAALAQIS